MKDDNDVERWQGKAFNAKMNGKRLRSGEREWRANLKQRTKEFSPKS